MLKVASKRYEAGLAWVLWKEDEDDEADDEDANGSESEGDSGEDDEEDGDPRSVLGPRANV